MARRLANENRPWPAILPLRTAGVGLEAVAECMPGASDARALVQAAAKDRQALTCDRDSGELVFARAVPPPPTIVSMRQGRCPPDAPGAVVLDLPAREDWVKGQLVLVQGRALRRRVPPGS